MFRWFVLVVFAASVGLSGWRRAQARRAGGGIPRSAESPGLIAGRLAIALPLFGGVVAYLVNPAWMAWASVELPAWVRWSGAGLGALVVPLVYWVLTTLGASVSETVLTRPQQRLVTTGPYRWVRHPLYTTGIALFVSMGLMAANWFILLFAVIALTAVRLVVIPREESHLIDAFGEAYRAYRVGTGALLPMKFGPRDPLS